MDQLFLCKKDVLYALKYFQDVIEKNMLQLLPGSATIVLETVIAVFNVLSNTLTNDERYPNHMHSCHLKKRFHLYFNL